MATRNGEHGMGLHTMDFFTPSLMGVFTFSNAP
jgi:hypothetical protein